MSRTIYFITHPNVVISRSVPVPRWPLSALGRAQMERGLSQPWVQSVTAIYSSIEQKAIDGAQILARHRTLGFQQAPGLGENDRSSTGFLEQVEFEAVATEFFANPGVSVRGWERAIDAQARIVATVERLVQSDRTAGAIAIVSHGAVGTLLYCQLTSNAIDRRYDQPANGGGNFFHFSLAPATVHSHWAAIDQAAI
jgi:broad specificity phosphatase PhoE